MDQSDSPKKKRARTVTSSPSPDIQNGTDNSESSSTSESKDSVTKTLPVTVENAAGKSKIPSNTNKQSKNLEPWNMFTSDLVTPKIEPQDTSSVEPVSVASRSPDGPSVEEVPVNVKSTFTMLPDSAVTVESMITIEPQISELVTPKKEPEEPLPEGALAPVPIRIDKVVTLKNEAVTPWTIQSATAASIGLGELGEEYADFSHGYYSSKSYNETILDEIEMLQFKNKHLDRENIKLGLKISTLEKCCAEATLQKQATLLKIESLESNNKRMNTVIREMEKRNKSLSSKVEKLQGERTEFGKIVQRLDLKLGYPSGLMRGCPTGGDSGAGKKISSAKNSVFL